MSFPNDELKGLSVDDLEEIDKACLYFEDQWLAGKSPDIRKFLPVSNCDSNSGARRAMLAELIRLDVEYRQRLGQPATPAHYCSVFPDDKTIIDSAFSDLNNDQQKTNGFGSLPFEDLKLESEFSVERFYARGGLGEIYVARDNRLNRTVAIKVPRNRDPGSMERLRLKREAEITGRLKHPGIVPVHATSHGGDGPPCYVMQFIEGQTFRDSVDAFHSSHLDSGSSKFRSREFRKLLQRLISICNAVAYTHDQGIIHRDIKPGNIMLGEFGETFLLDWGLAKQIGSDEYRIGTEPDQESRPDQDSWKLNSDETAASTKPGQPIGTPEFASPEQVRGEVENQDNRSDIYSLGATLYYLLAGKRAVELEDLTDLSTASAIRDIAPPKSLDPSVPADLDSICMKAIAFKADHRYRNVTDFSDELDRFLADEPIQSRNESWSTRVRRWTNKHPKMAYGIASGLSVALLALAVSSWFFSKQADELANALAMQTQTSKELKVANQSAEAYADQTRTALRTMSNRLVRHWFARQTEFSENERLLLQDIVSQYEAFSKMGLDDLSERVAQAESWQRVGRIQELLGQNEDALVSFTNAAELFSPMPVDADPELRTAQMITEFELGKLQFEAGELEGGLKVMEDAIGLFKSLADDFPDEPEYKLMLAQVQDKMGTIYVMARRPAEAIRLKTASAYSLRQLVQLQPDNIVYQTYRASNLTTLAIAMLNGDPESAVEKHKSAALIYEKLEQENSIYSDIDRASSYVMNCSGLGMALSRLKRNEEALESYENTIVAAARLTEEYPSFADGYLHLANAYRGAHNVYRSREDYRKAAESAQLAAKAADKAVELSPGKRNYLAMRSESQQAFGSALFLRGDLEEAEEALKDGVLYARETHQFEADSENQLELARTMLMLGESQLGLQNVESGTENFEEAGEILTDGVVKFPDDTRLRELLEQLQKKQKSLKSQDGATSSPTDANQ